jgi:hypothetical protein
MSDLKASAALRLIDAVNEVLLHAKATRFEDEGQSLGYRPGAMYGSAFGPHTRVAFEMRDEVYAELRAAADEAERLVLGELRSKP